MYICSLCGRKVRLLNSHLLYSASVHKEGCLDGPVGVSGKLWVFFKSEAENSTFYVPFRFFNKIPLFIWPIFSCNLLNFFYRVKILARNSFALSFEWQQPLFCKTALLYNTCLNQSCTWGERGLSKEGESYWAKEGQFWGSNTYVPKKSNLKNTYSYYYPDLAPLNWGS